MERLHEEKFKIIKKIVTHMKKTHNQHIWLWNSTCHDCLSLRQNFIALSSLQDHSDFDQSAAMYDYSLDFPEQFHRNLGKE